MTNNEYKLLNILRKEGVIVNENTEVHAMEVPELFHKMSLLYMSDEGLAKHFRNMIVLEEYETADSAKAELVSRGYEIAFLEKSIKFNQTKF